MTTTIRIKLRQSKVAGKPGTFIYQLIHDRKVKLFTTRLHLPPDQWDESRQCIIRSSSDSRLAVIQNRLETDLRHFRQAIDDLERQGTPYTVSDVIVRYRHPRTDVGFLSFLRLQIQRLHSVGRIGTARNYRRAYNSFSSFLQAEDIPLDCLSSGLVESYNAYLLRRGITRNSISFYMRILRAVYNKAVLQHLVPQTYPFRHVYTGTDHTRKRAVDEPVISGLCKLRLERFPSLELARNLFVFSYCTRGMAFVDMAYLRKCDIRHRVIHYTRRKTGQKLEIRLESLMEQIIGRYTDQVKDSPYVFPVLKTEDADCAYRQYQTALNYYNKLLKRLGELLGLEKRLSSYTSRHTWATAARNHNVPISVISAGMGHTSVKTTQIYLALLENSVIDEANKGIIDAIGCNISV